MKQLNWIHFNIYSNGFTLIEENCQFDDLFKSWRSELEIPITSKEEEEIIFPDYKIVNKTENDVLDLSNFKEFDFNFLQNSSGMYQKIYNL